MRKYFHKIIFVSKRVLNLKLLDTKINYLSVYFKIFFEKCVEIFSRIESKMARSFTRYCSLFSNIKSVFKIENILKIMKFISACSPFGISKKFVPSLDLFFRLSTFEISFLGVNIFSLFLFKNVDDNKNILVNVEK